MFFLKKTKYNNYMIKKLFLPLALSLSVAYSVSAQDSTMVKFDFASTADSAKLYNATLCQGAKLINYGTYRRRQKTWNQGEDKGS